MIILRVITDSSATVTLTERPTAGLKARSCFMTLFMDHTRYAMHPGRSIHKGKLSSATF